VNVRLRRSRCFLSRGIVRTGLDPNWTRNAYTEYVIDFFNIYIYAAVHIAFFCLRIVEQILKNLRANAGLRSLQPTGNLILGNFCRARRKSTRLFTAQGSNLPGIRAAQFEAPECRYARDCGGGEAVLFSQWPWMLDSPNHWHSRPPPALAFWYPSTSPRGTGAACGLQHVPSRQPCAKC